MRNASKSNSAPYDRPIAVDCLCAVAGGVGIAAIPPCGNAMPCCYNIAPMRFCGLEEPIDPPWRLAVAARPLFFDCGGARSPLECSISFAGALGDPPSVADTTYSLV